MPIPQISGGTRLSDLPSAFNPIIDQINAGVIQGSVMELDAVRYAHPNGNNANDGKTWGKAKKDVISAYDALPAGGGEIQYAEGTYVDSVNTDRGLWLVGPNSASYASPPTGWRQAKKLKLVGAGNQSWAANGAWSMTTLGGGSATDRNKPTIWIAGSNVPITFEHMHIQYPAIGARLGIDTDGATFINTSSVLFRESDIALNQVAGNGPGIELGYIFWLYFQNCVINGNQGAYTLTAASIVSGTTARFTTSIPHFLQLGDTVEVQSVTPAGYNGLWTVTAVTSTTFDANIGTSPSAGSVFGHAHPVRSYRRAGIAHDSQQIFPGQLASGLIFFEDCNFNNAGFHYNPSGTTSSGRIVIRNATFEGDFGAHSNPPVLHVRVPYGAASIVGSMVGIVVDNVEMADVVGGEVAVVVDGVDSYSSAVTVIDASVSGSATTINSRGGVPSRRRSADIENGAVWADVPAAKRTHGAAPVLFTNMVSTDASTWSSGLGGGTVTTGKKAPDGTTLAAAVTANNDGKELIRSVGTVNIGDWFYFGVWRRLHSGADSAFNYPLACVLSGSNYVYENGVNYFVANRNAFNDGAWEWVYGYAKVLSGNTGTAERITTLRAGTGNEIHYYAPLMIQIPASDGYDDEELLELFRTLRPWPNTAPQGSISTQRGQKLIAWGGLGVGNAAAATTPGSVVKKVEIFDQTGVSLGFVPVYNSIT